MKKLLLLVLLAPFVFGVSLQDAEDAYFNAQLEVEHARASGLPILVFDDLLIRMNSALEGRNASELLERARLLNASGDPDSVALASELFALIEQSLSSGLRPGVNYSLVVELGEQIKAKKAAAFDAREQIGLFEERVWAVEDSQFMGPVYESLSSAKAAYSDGRFSEVSDKVAFAESQLEQALVSAARERAFLKLARRNIVDYTKDHWKGMLIALGVLLILSVWGFFEVRAYSSKSKLVRLHAELVAVRKSMVGTQEQYYSGKMGNSVYRTRMETYRKRERDLKTELLTAQSLLKKYGKKSLFSRRG